MAIKVISYYEGEGLNPYRNIAVEMQLMEICRSDELIFYLWSNRNTVVIGRNQNAFAETDVEALEADGGYLARRYTGGGAVYHDEENLNFSFITPSGLHDKKKQSEVIIRAVGKLGVRAELSGRNDIECEGRKFSGNAYLNRNGKSLHHGTLLIAADLAKMQKYLNVKNSKMEAKGVKSVRSRVVNLSELCAVNKEILTANLLAAAEEVYGVKVLPLNAERFNLSKLEAEQRKLSCKEWIYGRNFDNYALFSHTYSWGRADVRYRIKEGRVADFKVYSDTLEADTLTQAEQLISGGFADKFERGENPIYNDLIEIFGGRNE